MPRRSRIYSITAGIFSLLFGLLMLASMLIGLMDTGIECLTITITVLLLLCGAFGIAGGILLSSRLKLARALLLAAAIFGLPLGFIFFVVFMYARKGTLHMLDNDAFRPTNIGASPW